MLPFGEWYTPLLILLYHTVCQLITIGIFYTLQWTFNMCRRKEELRRQMADAHERLQQVKEMHNDNRIGYSAVGPAAGDGSEAARSGSTRDED